MIDPVALARARAAAFASLAQRSPPQGMPPQGMPPQGMPAPPMQRPAPTPQMGAGAPPAPPLHIAALAVDHAHALARAGIRAPVSPVPVVHAALDRLQAAGKLPADVAQGLKTFRGPVHPMIIAAVQHEMLRPHGLHGG